MLPDFKSSISIDYVLHYLDAQGMYEKSLTTYSCERLHGIIHVTELKQTKIIIILAIFNYQLSSRARLYLIGKCIL
jgi:hypothetical protein